MTTKNKSLIAGAALAASVAQIAGATATPAASAAPAVVATAAPTKADKARIVFDRCYAMNPVPARKDIIKLAMDEAGLTKPGAATYLQNYKNKKGLTRTKLAAAAQAAVETAPAA